MTQDQINKLKELAQNATPGPWVLVDIGDESCAVVTKTPYELAVVGAVFDCNENRGRGLVRTVDMEYIAAANPVAIRELIAENECLEKEIKWLARQFSECPFGKDYEPDYCDMGYGEECTHFQEECWRYVARNAVEADNGSKN